MGKDSQKPRLICFGENSDFARAEEGSGEESARDFETILVGDKTRKNTCKMVS